MLFRLYVGFFKSFFSLAYKPDVPCRGGGEKYSRTCR